MSAIVCGKRSPSVFFEENHHHHNHQQTKKKFRRCSFEGAAAGPPLAWLQSMFPQMDPQLLERVFEASGNDLDSAIRSLNELQMESTGLASVATISDTEIKTSIQLSGSEDAHEATNVGSEKRDILEDISGAMGVAGGQEAGSTNSACMNDLPRNGSEWVEVLVKEMMNASDVNDAKARASRVLDVLEKSIMANASSGEAMQSFHKENVLLKEQLETLLGENNILKQAVAIQHKRQKDYEEKSQELHHLKQLASQYQEQVAKLEVSNYALAMHLRLAQQSNSIPGHFHPDVF
ncbi:CUE domain containing protein [Iris pallida]|uniref:CUE domain containing protein n=1 Tax=Iris pallida TaxID=29817 RepID=A0AAX6F3H9_IRIPA|nr:CUE domain containing protein [Iris pallida]KAJ6815042.1 CUE domain containing protein [Iris pallida]